MPEILVSIGGREFQVACHEGEEHYLQSAAKMLDTEAQVLVSQIGRLPEARMLLMAGLMLADKTADLEDKLKNNEKLLSETQLELEKSQTEGVKVQTVEVTKIPQELIDKMSKLAARAEVLADRIEDM